MPRPHFTPGKDTVPILQEDGWAPGPGWTGGKSRPHRNSIPDRPARSQSLYRLSYPTQIWWDKFSQKHNYKYMAKWWCLLAMEKRHVSACGGHLQVLPTFLLKEFYITLHLPNRKDPHPATYKFIDPIDIRPNFSLTKARKMMMRSPHHHAV